MNHRWFVSPPPMWERVKNLFHFLISMQKSRSYRKRTGRKKTTVFHPMQHVFFSDENLNKLQESLPAAMATLHGSHRHTSPFVFSHIKLKNLEMTGKMWFRYFHFFVQLFILTHTVNSDPTLLKGVYVRVIYLCEYTGREVQRWPVNKNSWSVESHIYHCSVQAVRQLSLLLNAQRHSLGSLK